jgi:hypothetical protein
VAAGARLIVIGSENGLHRDTAHWIRVPAGDETAVLRRLMSDPTSVSTEQAIPDPSVLEVFQGRPAAVLAGPRIGQDPDALAAVRALAERLEAVSGDAPVGIPSIGANARGLLDLAPEIPTTAGAACTLRFGEGVTGSLPLNGESIQVAYRAGTGDEGNTVVVLPLAHPYEQDGSFTNIEGRIQFLRAGARMPRQALADWEIAVRLAQKLDVSVPADLESIRAEIAAARADYGRVLLTPHLEPSRA